VILLWQAEAFEPVHEIVGKEQKMEVGFVGGELMSGNLGQRVVGLQFLDDEFHRRPTVVEAIDRERSKTKVGDESVIGAAAQGEQRGLWSLFLRQVLAHHHKAVRSGPAVGLVETCALKGRVSLATMTNFPR